MSENIRVLQTLYRCRASFLAGGRRGLSARRRRRDCKNPVKTCTGYIGGERRRWNRVGNFAKWNPFRQNTRMLPEQRLPLLATRTGNLNIPALSFGKAIRSGYSRGCRAEEGAVRRRRLTLALTPNRAAAVRSLALSAAANNTRMRRSRGKAFDMVSSRLFRQAIDHNGNSRGIPIDSLSSDYGLDREKTVPLPCNARAAVRSRA